MASFDFSAGAAGASGDSGASTASGASGAESLCRLLTLLDISEESEREHFMEKYADKFPTLQVLTREHDLKLSHSNHDTLAYKPFSFWINFHELIEMIELKPTQFLFDSFGTLLIKPTRNDGDKRMVIISGYTCSSVYLELSEDDKCHRKHVFYDTITRCESAESTESTQSNPFFDPVLDKMGYSCDCKRVKIHPLKRNSHHFHDIDTIDFELNALLGGVPAIDAHIAHLYCMDCMNEYLDFNSNGICHQCNEYNKCCICD